MSKESKWIIALILLLIAAGSAFGIAMGKLGEAKRQQSISEANLRAERDTVRIFRSRAELADILQTLAAVRFQLQVRIDSDSITKLGTALSEATEALNLTHVALTQAIVEQKRTQASLDEAIVELANVMNPEGRQERIAAFQLDTTFVQADIVVVVPQDTSQGIELEVVFSPKPFDLTYSLACTPEHDAVATFESPLGITIRPSKGIVNPEICHPKSSSFAFRLFVPDLGKILYGGTGAVLGYLAGKASSSTVNVGLDLQNRTNFGLVQIRF